jgi:hypothetical protein
LLFHNLSLPLNILDVAKIRSLKLRKVMRKTMGTSLSTQVDTLEELIKLQKEAREVDKRFQFRRKQK